MERAAEPTDAATSTVPPSEVPISDAAIRWCAPALIAELKAAVDEFRRASPLAGDGLFWKLDVTGIFVPGILNGSTFWAALMRLQRARDAVQGDFCNRVQAGEVRVSGLPTKPALESKRITFPTTWGAVARFDFSASAATIAERRFEDVRACHDEVADAPSRATNDALAKPPRGRPKKDLAGLAAIAATRARDHNNEREASILLAAYIEKHPKKRPPALSTVSDNLNAIYEMAAKEREQ